MKIAMLGGTFDPIHCGHIMLGERFAAELGLDKVLVIPTRTAPHKAASATLPEHRLEMCRLAVQGSCAPFEVSDIELKRDGLSYSFYTLKSLSEQYPGCELYMLTGADMIMGLDTWHRYDELRELATFCTVPRGDITVQMIREKAEKLEGCRVVVSEQPLLQVSSTQLRAAIASGESLEGLVPPAVEEYIMKNRLYR